MCQTNQQRRNLAPHLKRRIDGSVKYQFEADAFEWRGPAPFVFLRMPDDQALELREQIAQLSYGWGCIPADITIGKTTVYTALIPKDGGYLVPLKLAIRKPERVEIGDRVAIEVRVRE